MLVLAGFSLGMSGMPVFPEILSCAYENGFEEGLSLLGLVSGLFSAIWSLGSFVGPTLGGFLDDKLGFEWAAAMQDPVVETCWAQSKKELIFYQVKRSWKFLPFQAETQLLVTNLEA
ncbi:hypothetical protein JD844_024502 [Phrynosoma platyrhinos]|uniref:Solute carrier family 18 member B1 n=1 Tax=Phrynosoma platyrhinos TaxID=52577 RepID=A0ABQ7SY76_PHRPL|nr:hypothetical protein JD844_024502 [Phrynosoma platyrhinos]